MEWQNTISLLKRLHCLHCSKKTESVKVLVTQSCPTLCDPMDCSPPGSSVNGIIQARIRSGLPLPSPGDPPHQGPNLGLPPCRQTLYQLHHQGSLVKRLEGSKSEWSVMDNSYVLHRTFFLS